MFWNIWEQACKIFKAFLVWLTNQPSRLPVKILELRMYSKYTSLLQQLFWCDNNILQYQMSAMIILLFV